jgi:putative transcriptional regulator
MIVFKLKQRLFERGMNQLTFSKKIKMRYNTINAFYHGYAKRARFQDLNKMCEYLDCSLTDLIEYIPDKK